MNCKISCSFGEIVDKVTILNIKRLKAKDRESIKHIENELDIIKKENPLVKTKDKLFKKLSNININLWDLEDNIRDKSRKKEFDKQYIHYAEQIHIQNDKRYKIKKQINEKYNSALREVKIYKNNENNEINRNNRNNGIKTTKLKVEYTDIRNLETGKFMYTDGKYNESMDKIEKIMNKYKNYDNIDSFFIDLLFSYSNICSIFSKPYPYFNKLKAIMKDIDIIDISDEQKKFCKSIYTTKCLEYKLYEEEYTHINLINNINGPNINAMNMSFFKNTDVDKVLLVYDGGGLGDKFMLSRFIPRLCDIYSKNKIIYFVNDCIVWFFNEIFRNIKNIKIVSYKYPQFIGNYDYHCNLLSLIKHFRLTYNTIYFSPIFKNIKVQINEYCKNIIKSFDSNTYILNWKGNDKNPHEKNNRSMNLINAIPLFKLNNIKFLVISKDLTQQEMKLLNRYNIKYIGKNIDNVHSFYDTISILRHSAGLISTDTSLPHLSLSMDIKTYVLLTLGCEWRWTKDETTNWYPNAILLRQKKIGDWSYPVQKLIELLEINNK